MRPTRLAALTAALLVLPATAAWAHPSLNPASVPIGEPVETTLVVPHGCSTGEGVMPEGEGEAVPTTRVDLEVLAGMTVEPGEVDGWDTEVQDGAVVWTDAGGATTDPIELPITLTVDSGGAGDRLALSVYQECENGDSYRWTDGSDDTPPVALELTAGETGSPTTEPEGTEDTGGTDDGTEEATASGAASEDAATEDVAATDDTADVAAEPVSSGSGSVVPGLLIAMLVLAAIGVGILLARRRGAA